MRQADVLRKEVMRREKEKGSTVVFLGVRHRRRPATAARPVACVSCSPPASQQLQRRWQQPHAAHDLPGQFRAKFEQTPRKTTPHVRDNSTPLKSTGGPHLHHVQRAAAIRARIICQSRHISIHISRCFNRSRRAPASAAISRSVHL